MAIPVLLLWTPPGPFSFGLRSLSMQLPLSLPLSLALCLWLCPCKCPCLFRFLFLWKKIFLSQVLSGLPGLYNGRHLETKCQYIAGYFNVPYTENYSFWVFDRRRTSNSLLCPPTLPTRMVPTVGTHAPPLPQPYSRSRGALPLLLPFKRVTNEGCEHRRVPSKKNDSLYLHFTWSLDKRQIAYKFYTLTDALALALHLQGVLWFIRAGRPVAVYSI